VHFFFREVEKLREQIERLAVLQAIELRVQEMEREKSGIPQSIVFLEEELRKEEDKLRAEKAEMEKLGKERRQKEQELEEETDKVKKVESRVFEIKTNKEYQAVLKEIESAKKLNRQREEEILEILEKLEQGQKRIAGAEKELEEKRKEMQRKVSALKQKEASYEQEMAGEVRQKEEKEKEIPAGLLSKYRMLAEKRHGIAVARVAHGACQACHMNLRPQLYIELQKQEALIMCPNCSRILFWDNGSTKAEKT
jgi:predicted  nucleic acid-binding Zn-ribbon protein